MLTDKQGKLLAYFEELAAIGEPCPSLSALAVRFKAAQSTLIAEIGALVDAGAITQVVTHRGRIVTHVASGLSTKDFDVPAPLASAPVATVKTPEARTKIERRAMIARAARKLQTPAAAPEATDPIQERPRTILPDTVADPVEAAPAEVAAAPVAVEPPAEAEPATSEAAGVASAAPIAAGALPVPGLAADVEFVDGELRLTVWLSTDRAFPRCYHPFLTVPLDEPHAVELLGSTAIALRAAREATGAVR